MIAIGLYFSGSVEAKKNTVYNDLLCTILSDSTVLNKLPLIFPISVSTAKWDHKVCVSKRLLSLDLSFFADDLKGQVSKDDIIRLSNPLDFSGKDILVKHMKCGVEETSPVKVFFTDIKEGFVNVEIAYSTVKTDGYNFTKESFLYSPCLSILYQIKDGRITNMGVHVLTE